jgi:hypothetical protein
MHERLRCRVAGGRPMTDVRREFGISQKTGYKFRPLYEHGLK